MSAQDRRNLLRRLRKIRLAGKSKIDHRHAGSFLNPLYVGDLKVGRGVKININIEHLKMILWCELNVQKAFSIHVIFNLGYANNAVVLCFHSKRDMRLAQKYMAV